MKDIKFKNNDNLADRSKLIPLLSDINDKEGIIIEHSKLNESNNLKYALIKYNNRYFFIDSERIIMEIKQYTDNHKIMCPNCKQDLYVMQGYKRDNGTEVKAHLKHYINSEDCDFKQYYNSKSKKINKGKFIGESKIHKELKLSIATEINSKGIYLNIPISYNIEIDRYECWANIQYEKIYIDRAEIEKWAIEKGNEEVGGYKPDITAYDKNNKEIYIEVTYQTGKTVEEYYNKWNKLNRNVIEVRKKDNVDVEISCSQEEGYLKEIYIHDDKVFRFLYSPVLDEARREKLRIESILATKEKEEFLKKEHINFIYEKLRNVKRYLEASKNVKVVKNGKEYKYIANNGYEYKNYWFKASFKDVSINLKIPNIVVDLLNKINGLNVEYSPYKTKYIVQN